MAVVVFLIPVFREMSWDYKSQLQARNLRHSNTSLTDIQAVFNLTVDVHNSSTCFAVHSSIRLSCWTRRTYCNTPLKNFKRQRMIRQQLIYTFHRPVLLPTRGERANPWNAAKRHVNRPYYRHDGDEPEEPN